MNCIRDNTKDRQVLVSVGKDYSFFRTVTVGTGITPALLTAAIKKNCRPLVDFNHRWGLAPRPESNEDFTAFYSPVCSDWRV